MTSDELYAVRQLVCPTTPGPWEPVLGDDGELYGFGPFSYTEPWDRSAEEFGANVEFSRQARSLVPRMLGEIARLRAQVHALEARTAVPASPSVPRIPAGGDFRGW
ncbi:hypothetical protein ACFWPV_10225 [Streptomyces uncialis]|uniref:hypothetical protein n=1 Tax=Streptomyces uncialis TaxID=1048205 RepID=UPI003661A8F7